MKTTLSILAFVIIAAPASPKIGTIAATNYYNQEATVTGKVAQVTMRPTVTFLNLDKPYPDSPFAVVIFPRQRQLIGDVNVLRGKTIEIKDRIKNYHDKPEITLDDLKQLTVFDAKGRDITSTILNSTNSPAAVVPTNAPPAATSTNLPEIM